ncbi:MAG: hypothetical protein NTX59_09165 [Elusimicrobia bacterium]|nr:hypothetical protein [Elusimicrobiota bacterium]
MSKKIKKSAAVERRPPSLTDKVAGLAASRGFNAFVCVLTLAALYLILAKPLIDLDIWWHLKTGQVISETGKVPGVDIFSYVISGKPWVTFEWLSQLIFYKCWQLGAEKGIYLLRQALAAVTFGLLLARGFPAAMVASAVIFFGLTFMGGSVLERPQMFTYLFALGCRLLAPQIINARPGATLCAAALIAVHILWANMHGGASAVGILIISCYAAVAAARGDRPAFKRSAWLLGAVFCATLVNIHGIKIYTHLFLTWFDPAQRWVLEWKPLTSSSPGFLPYCLYLLLLGAASLRLAGAERAAALFIGALFGGFFGFRSSRNVALAFFITAPDAISGLRIYFSEKRKLYAFMAVPFFVCLCLSPRFMPEELRAGKLFPEPLSRQWLSGVCDFILARDIPGRMYNDYVAGGYLIWRLGPARQIFVDGRSLEYGATLMERLARISGKEGFEDLDREFKFDYLVFQQRKDDRLLYLDKDPDWRCVYFDDGGLIYAHRARAAAKTAAGYGYRYLRPNEQSFAYLREYAEDAQKAKETIRELDRAIAQTPPWLSANACLMKSAFLRMTTNEITWARWITGVGGRFRYPEWLRQLDEAKNVLQADTRNP